MQREVRTFAGAEIRAKASEKPGADGYAAVFNRVTDLHWFKEVIKPGAFARALRENQDVRCLQNHNSDMILGRTKSGSLGLVEDTKGLRFSCDFPDTQIARDLHTLLQRGDIDQCSFGFMVRKQTWREEQTDSGDLEVTREIEDVDLFDVSIVTFPAYQDTSVDPRSAPTLTSRLLWPEGVPTEVRSHMSQKRAAECECDCAPCEDGNCQDCTNADCYDENCDHTMRSAAPKNKSVDGESLEADAFIIVGNQDDPVTWRLAYRFSTEEKTKSHLRNLLARFNRLKDLSEEEKSKAWGALVRLCKEHDVAVSAEDANKWFFTDAQFRDFQPPPVVVLDDQARAQARVKVIQASL